MRPDSIGLVGALLLTLSCAPAAVDYSSLTTAADVRQRAAGAAVAPTNATVQALLSRPLTAESAARVALLNNRGVRAAVEELGISQARFAQVRRLPNPTVEAAMHFHGDDRPELELGAMIDVTELLLLASRSSAAGAEVDAAKLAAIGAIVDLSFEARRAFFSYQAAAELMGLRRTVLHAFQASADLAMRLREAGNVTELDWANQQALFEEARVQFQAVEVDLASAREQLNAVLGLWGRGVEWTAIERLPEPPQHELALQGIERLVIQRSLDLAIARQRFGAAATRANVARAAGFLPELKAGVSAEREEDWGVGPAVEIEVPLFYQGQGEIGVAQAQMRQQQNVYASVAVELRARARDAAARLTAKREAAIYYKTVLLPLKQRIVQQSQLEYNGMLIGLFQLLQAKRDEVEAGAAYVGQQHDYWIARTNVEQLLAGRRPSQAAVAPSGDRSPSPSAGEDAH